MILSRAISPLHSIIYTTNSSKRGKYLKTNNSKKLEKQNTSLNLFGDKIKMKRINTSRKNIKLPSAKRSIFRNYGIIFPESPQMKKYSDNSPTNLTPKILTTNREVETDIKIFISKPSNHKNS